MTVNFSIWVAILRNGTVSGDFDLLKSKLGGYAPEWVAMLRNRTVPEGYFGGKIVILGGFAPEISTVSKPPKLGGHAPEHPENNNLVVAYSDNNSAGVFAHQNHRLRNIFDEAQTSLRNNEGRSFVLLLRI